MQSCHSCICFLFLVPTPNHDRLGYDFENKVFLFFYDPQFFLVTVHWVGSSFFGMRDWLWHDSATVQRQGQKWDGEKREKNQRERISCVRTDSRHRASQNSCTCTSVCVRLWERVRGTVRIKHVCKYVWGHTCVWDKLHFRKHRVVHVYISLCSGYICWMRIIVL